MWASEDLQKRARARGAGRPTPVLVVGDIPPPKCVDAYRWQIPSGTRIALKVRDCGLQCTWRRGSSPKWTLQQGAASEQQPVSPLRSHGSRRRLPLWLDVCGQEIRAAKRGESFAGPAHLRMANTAVDWSMIAMAPQQQEIRARFRPFANAARNLAVTESQRRAQEKQE